MGVYLENNPGPAAHFHHLMVPNKRHKQQSSIFSNAGDKRYFAETHPVKNVTKLCNAILSKTRNRVAKHVK